MEMILTTPDALEAVIKKILGTQQEVKKGYYTIKQVAEYLQICEGSVKNLVRDNKLKQYRAGSSKNSIVRYKVADVEKLFEDREK